MQKEVLPCRPTLRGGRPTPNPFVLPLVYHLRIQAKCLNQKQELALFEAAGNRPGKLKDLDNASLATGGLYHRHQ